MTMDRQPRLMAVAIDANLAAFLRYRTPRSPACLAQPLLQPLPGSRKSGDTAKLADGDRAGECPSSGADACRYGPVPRLDFLEGERPELTSLEFREDVRLDQVPVLGDSGWLEFVEHSCPNASLFAGGRGSSATSPLVSSEALAPEPAGSPLADVLISVAYLPTESYLPGCTRLASRWRALAQELGVTFRSDDRLNIS
jgi:hypothetical protein